MNDDQALTRLSEASDQKRAADQPFGGLDTRPADARDTLLVLGPSCILASCDLNLPVDRGKNRELGRDNARRESLRPKKEDASKPRGGWPTSPRLHWLHWRRDVRSIYDVAHEMEKNGRPFTHFITIMPLSGQAPERKKTCSRVVAHVGQVLTRQGHPHFGLTVIEHPLDADLHGNHLLHVPSSLRDRVETWNTSQADIRVERIWDIDGLLAYLTKERQRLSPEFEDWLRKTRGPRWKRCRPVSGKRWSITTAVQELVAPKDS